MSRESLERQLCTLLRTLTTVLQERTGEGAHGLLGGEDGYGVEYKNDVFEMHPYWWGDCGCGFEQTEQAWCDANGHSDDCYQTDLKSAGVWDMSWDDPNREKLIAEICSRHGDLDRSLGCMTHCTCGSNALYVEWRKTHDHDPACAVVRPNFWHYATGFKARWYKYINRGMEWENIAAGRKAIRAAIRSIQDEDPRPFLMVD